MTSVPGVFCFEGDWENRLDDPKSVVPLLEAAQRIIGMPFIHRTIGTTEELDYYIGKWLQKQHARYTIGQFAFHGKEDGIGIGRTDVDLDHLANVAARLVKELKLLPQGAHLRIELIPLCLEPSQIPLLLLHHNQVPF